MVDGNIGLSRPVREPLTGEPGKWCADPPAGCGRYLSLDSFHRNRLRADGYMSRCRACKRRGRLEGVESIAVARAAQKAKVRAARTLPRSGRAEDLMRAYLETGVMPDERTRTLDEILDEEEQ